MSMGAGVRMQEWWPNQLDLSVLRQFSAEQNPLGGSFDYAQAFQSLDYEALKKELTKTMTTSQDWWPADFGHYGGLMIRLAWHSAGTYRVLDGRGGGGSGQQRFAPLNSWPDNGNLDKARRLLWPVKQKYGSKISWADLYLLAGNVALESMGFKTVGFAGGRQDTWQGDHSIYWGGEKAWFPDPKDKEVRYNGSDDIYARSDKLEKPLGAANMGLIYVDPRGPNASGDPKASAKDIKMTFGRMGMNVKETAALIAGGHAFGKTHGASSDSACGPPPEGAPLHQMGLGWKSNHGNGMGEDAITSGLEVTWSKTPTKWSNDFLKALFGNEWTLTKSPGGAPQFEALNGGLDYPHAYDTSKKQRARMLVSDVALREDEEFAKICRRWLENFDELSHDFAHAWFKLLHRDMGPVSRYLGPEVPKETFIWQDPLPTADYAPIDESDVASLKSDILASGLSVSELVTTAWASASTFRGSDKRGGANGARIALEPQKSWEVNNPKQLDGVLKKLGEVRSKFNGGGMKEVSLADLIVLGGVAAVEKAAKDAGHDIKVPFTAGRVDATQESTDVESFEYLHPEGDAFRNFRDPKGAFSHIKTEQVLVDKAQTLTLTIPETVVLVGGMRALGATFDGGNTGVLTSTPGKLTPAFFTNLLDMKYTWKADNDKEETFTGAELSGGKAVWKATRADLVFGAHPEFRAVSEVYAESGNEGKFANDFARAWDKVMMLDRFDVRIQKK